MREFPRGDTLALFADVYDNLRTTAHRVAIKTTVHADDGTVVVVGDLGMAYDKNRSLFRSVRVDEGATLTIADGGV